MENLYFTTDDSTSTSITGSYRGQRIAGGKTSTTESGISKLFIVSWSGLIKSNVLMDFTDILPTFLDIAEVIRKSKRTPATLSII